ncbi:MAG: two-component system, NarL family, response regulator DegU [Thermomicrobiales bacterium]|jgi:DNA-binding NarL/FixJ family response regulator|nr:two-component system, NarL family, response regulator DegU [Thermomicrobiales bacterium]
MLAYRILVVDEDPSYRLNLTQTLEQDVGLKVVAQASNGHEALRLCEAHRPDLVLVGRRLPGLTGVQVAAAIRRHQSRSRVLLLAPVVDYDHCLAATQAGAAGIVPRFADHQTLRTTVRTVLAGSDLVQPWAGCDGLVMRAASKRLPHVQDLIGTLTAREFEVFDCLLIGLSTKETSSALGIAEQTVKNRVSGVLHKLRLDSRMAAIRLALSRGWAEYGPGPHVDPVVSLARPWISGSDQPVPPTMLNAPTEGLSWA